MSLGQASRLLAAALMLMAASPAPNQKTFAAPSDAARALFQAAATNDTAALLEVLGPEAQRVVFSGDAVSDRATRERFVQAYEEANRLEGHGKNARLIVGKDEWPFPIPLVATETGWRFDGRQGREELRNRRIGRNELAVIQVLQAYVDAQREYYLANPQGDTLLTYAQKLVSSADRRDGLFYPTTPAEPASPLGEFFAAAQAEGYDAPSGNGRDPYHGYHYRVLTSQGRRAPGGAYDYVVHGKMIGGFALVAWPASYGRSGVMTFIVSHDGSVYQRDLRRLTALTARKMKSFDPGLGWKRVTPGKN
jgi:hypothetical protein